MSTADQLAAEMRRHRALYYAGTPEISDSEFDALEDRLRALDPAHEVLAEVGAAPSAEVAAAEVVATIEAPVDELARELTALSDPFYAGTGGEGDKATVRRYKALWTSLVARAPDHPALAGALLPEGLDWPKARHEIPMGSLNKVNTADELIEWVTRCDQLAAALPREPISSALCVTEKLDGLSVEVVYAGGRVERAITRGDGTIGEQITPNVLRMEGVPATIADPRRLSVRGEIVLRRAQADAYRAFRERVRGPLGDISLRNTAAGLARANKPDMVAGVRYLTVYFYDLEGAEGLRTEKEKLELLRALGFTVPHVAFGDREAIQAEFAAYAGGRRAALDYEIDGLVVRADDLDTATLLGDLNNRPRAAVAYKFESEMQVTKLLRVDWSTGDSGRITPVATVEPVRLAGAKVTQASLHNLANVERLGVDVGDEVLISRRNDVIPYVEKVVAKLAEGTAAAPSVCVSCQAPVAREGEYLTCKNLDCPARRIGRLRQWIGRLELLNWGEKTLIRLFEEGLAREPADLYRITPEQLMALDGFGETTAKKLLEPLHALKKIPLDRFIAALGIESVSIETGSLLVRAGYDSMQRIAEATREDLAAIAGLGEIKADKIKEGVGGRLDEVARLAEVGVVPVAPKEGGPLAGLTFCFSGSHARPRKELEGIVEKNGGRVASGVTKGVAYLVLADANSTSSKAEKARKIGTVVIDEAGFDAVVKERGGEA